MTDWPADRDRLGAYIPGRLQPKPKNLRISDGRLLWDLEEWAEAPDHQRDILDEFIDLADDLDGSEILRFARRWGPLFLCKHGLPYAHRPFWRSLGGSEQPTPDAPCGPIGPNTGEDLNAWRTLARKADIIRRLASDRRDQRDHRQGRQVAKDWQTLDPGFQVSPMPTDKPELFELVGEGREFWEHLVAGHRADARHRDRLASEISRWLEFGGVSLCVIWGETPRPQLGFAPFTVFGAIALKLAMECCLASSLVTCGYCGEPISGRKQRPREGHIPACKECRNKTPAKRKANRRNQRRRRESLRQGRQVANQVADPMPDPMSDGIRQDQSRKDRIR